MVDEPNEECRADQIDDKRNRAQLDAAVEQLRGLFDGLVIIATYQQEDGATVTLSRTDGNWHAQNGAVRHWVDKRESRAGIEAVEEHEQDKENE